MQTDTVDGSNQEFNIPDNVVEVRIDPQSGTLAANESEDAVSALFKIGTEPK